MPDGPIRADAGGPRCRRGQARSGFALRSRKHFRSLPMSSTSALRFPPRSWPGYFMLILKRRLPSVLYRGFPNPRTFGETDALPTWKSATQQVWKPALQGRAAHGWDGVMKMYELAVHLPHQSPIQWARGHGGSGTCASEMPEWEPRKKRNTRKEKGEGSRKLMWSGCVAWQWKISVRPFVCGGLGACMTSLVSRDYSSGCWWWR